MLAKARQADVTIYAMDVAGLSHVSTSQASDIALGQVASVSRSQTGIGGSLAEAKEKSRQGDTMNQAVRASDSQAALRALSEGTGGFLIANTNEYRKPFQKIVDDLDVHYEASYHPASDKDDGRLRKIDVKATRGEWTVESRKGYFAIPESKDPMGRKPYEVFGLAALSVTPRPNSFVFSTAAYGFRGGREVLAFRVPGTSLGALPEPGRGTHRMHASVTALVKDAGGQVVDEYSVDAPYDAPDANLPAIQAAEFTYTHPVTLSPGKYSVETAVIDWVTGKVSAGALPFEVAPSQGTALGISSGMLVQNIEPAGEHPDAADPLVVKTKRLVPFAGPTLKADAAPYAYFLVYPNQASRDKPKLEVEFRVGSEVVANQTSELPPPDASGAIPMIIKAAKHTGDCELRITAVQGSQRAATTIRYKVTGP